MQSNVALGATSSSLATPSGTVCLVARLCGNQIWEISATPFAAAVAAATMPVQHVALCMSKRIVESTPVRHPPLTQLCATKDARAMELQQQPQLQLQLHASHIHCLDATKVCG